MSDPACIFCKIAKKEIPAEVVYEDEHVLAFLDIQPLARGHTLVIPKEHASLLQDLPADAAGALGRAVSTVSGHVQRGMEAPGATVAVNNGPVAGQEVPHVHVHVVPRFEGDGFGPIHALFSNRPDVPKEEITKIGEQIRSA